MPGILLAALPIRTIPRGTYETDPEVYFPSGTIGFPSSSKHFEMSKVARVLAMVKNKTRKAKCLPGQILEISCSI